VLYSKVCSTFQLTAIKITYYHQSRRFIILTTRTYGGRGFPPTLGTHSRSTFNCYRIYLTCKRKDKGKTLSVNTAKAYAWAEVLPFALLSWVRRMCVRSWRSVHSNTEFTYPNSPLVTRLIGLQKEYRSLDQEKNALSLPEIMSRFLETRHRNTNISFISKIQMVEVCGCNSFETIPCCILGLDAVCLKQNISFTFFKPSS
jgi:hypothetical protein